MRTPIRLRAARAGFTLAEMLMAIAIIAVLIALSAAAILRFMDVGPYNATAANLGKLKGSLDAQWQAVVKKANDEPMNIDPSMLGFANTPVTDPAVRTRYVDYKMMQAFPISFAEALNPSTNPLTTASTFGPWRPYDDFLRRLLNINLSHSAVPPMQAASLAARCAPPQTQQAICLMMIVERGPQNAGVTADKIAGGMVKKLEVRIASDAGTVNSAEGLVDSWGRELLFTRNYPPGSNNASPQFVVLSTGAIRGKLKPWGRVRIVTPAPAPNMRPATPPTVPVVSNPPGPPWLQLGPEQDWELPPPMAQRRPWNPDHRHHNLATWNAEDMDKVLSTYAPIGKQ
jgi:prepilin-type N-terminal cleavage/methylation domain-containing protein